jgi:YidC/Oxa1 family membrane protein insertase
VGGIFAFFQHLFSPVVAVLSALLGGMHHVVPIWGLDLVLLALVIRIVLWPLSQSQFKSMAEMQKVAPLVKAIQAKYKDNPQEMNTRVMALYKEHNVNPFASCLPLLIQLPILLSLFYAVQNVIKTVTDSGQLASFNFLWINQAFAAQFPNLYYPVAAVTSKDIAAQSFHFFAGSLAQPDVALLALYVVSMYFSVRFGSPPSTDPAMAQQQKIMAFISPLMIAFFGFKAHWPSALIVYWFSLNVFTMAQQLFLYRRYGLIGKPATVAAAEPVLETGAGKAARLAQPKNVTPAKNGKAAGRNGAATAKRTKKGAN